MKKVHLLALIIAIAANSCNYSPEKETLYIKSVEFDNGTSIEDKLLMSARVVPTDLQLEWQTLEMTAFVHFTINTYTDLEWGHGDESPEIFNPVEFDAMQWANAVKDAGMKMIIVTCKHHDGFCLWPSETTEHSVKASPWKDGNGDIVMEVKEACEKTGLKFGIYLSPWDRNADCYGDSPTYNKFFMTQLTELLTWYGKVDEVWFDGANGEGPSGKKQIYDWDAYYSLISELQPEALVAIVGEDIRWVGTESGYGRETEWSVTPMAPGGRPESAEINKELGLSATSEDLGSKEVIASAGKLYWHPSEVDVSIRPGWFYHKSQDDQVKSLAKLVDIYFSSVGRNSVLLLNIPPDKRGLLHENDVARLKEFGRYISSTFDLNFASGAEINIKKGKFLTDNKRTTGLRMPSENVAIELKLREKSRFNVLALQEYIETGQRVESFEMETLIEGNWVKICESTTIGYKKLIRFPEVESDMIRITILNARDIPVLSEIGLYYAPEILTDPVITRNKSGLVSITNETDGPAITYTLDGSEPDRDSEVYTGPFLLRDGGTVKAKSFINNFAKSGATIIEDFDICSEDWKIISYSDQVLRFSVTNAIDGDPGTMWHTHWEGNIIPHPHYISVDMGSELILKGFTYYPRVDENKSGTIATFSYYTSLDGNTWDKLITNGEFSNIKNNPIKQYISFDKSVKARYFKFESLTGAFDEPWVSVGDLGVITK